MKWRLVLLLVVLALGLTLSPVDALAAPGGKIAAAVAKSFWGRALMAVLVLVFLPLIIYVMVREAVAERRTLKDLARLRSVQPAFDWLTLKDRVTDCFHRVHAAWRKEEMAQASAWMTDWYWQNQQLVNLDRWAEQGLVNRCTVKKMVRVKPLHIACRNDEEDFSGSRVVVSVTANMEDYLEDRATGKVVEGEKGYKDVEAVWTFELAHGVWRVANIEEDALSLYYARLVNEVPDVVERAGAARRLQA